MCHDTKTTFSCGCYTVADTSYPQQQVHNNSSGTISNSNNNMAQTNTAGSISYRCEHHAAIPRKRPILSIITTPIPAPRTASIIPEEDENHNDNNNNNNDNNDNRSENNILTRKRSYRTSHHIFSFPSSSNYFNEQQQPMSSSERLAGNISPSLQPKQVRRIRRDGLGLWASWRDFTYVPSHSLNDEYYYSNNGNTSGGEKRSRSVNGAVDRKPRGTPPAGRRRALGYI